MTGDLWNGLRGPARARLTQRNYELIPLAERLATTGVEVAELFAQVFRDCVPIAQM